MDKQNAEIYSEVHLSKENRRLLLSSTHFYAFFIMLLSFSYSTAKVIVEDLLNKVSNEKTILLIFR